MCYRQWQIDLLPSVIPWLGKAAMSDNQKHDPARCQRCGSETKIVTSGVQTFRQSYMNVFHCQACGGIESIEVPHEPPGKRT